MADMCNLIYTVFLLRLYQRVLFYLSCYNGSLSLFLDTLSKFSQLIITDDLDFFGIEI